MPEPEDQLNTTSDADERDRFLQGETTPEPAPVEEGTTPEAPPAPTPAPVEEPPAPRTLEELTTAYAAQQAEVTELQRANRGLRNDIINTRADRRTSKVTHESQMDEIRQAVARLRDTPYEMGDDGAMRPVQEAPRPLTHQEQLYATQQATVEQNRAYRDSQWTAIRGQLMQDQSTWPAMQRAEKGVTDYLTDASQILQGQLGRPPITDNELRGAFAMYPELAERFKATHGFDWQRAADAYEGRDQPATVSAFIQELGAVAAAGGVNGAVTPQVQPAPINQQQITAAAKPPSMSSMGRAAAPDPGASLTDEIESLMAKAKKGGPAFIDSPEYNRLLDLVEAEEGDSDDLALSPNPNKAFDR